MVMDYAEFMAMNPTSRANAGTTNRPHPRTTRTPEREMHDHNAGPDVGETDDWCAYEVVDSTNPENVTRYPCHLPGEHDGPHLVDSDIAEMYIRHVGQMKQTIRDLEAGTAYRNERIAQFNVLALEILEEANDAIDYSEDKGASAWVDMREYLDRLAQIVHCPHRWKQVTKHLAVCRICGIEREREADA